MSRVIHKQYITGAGIHELEVEEVSRFISVANQNGALVIWYEATLGVRKIKRKIYVVETGKDIPSLCDFIGTALFLDGEYVVHVYAEREVK